VWGWRRRLAIHWLTQRQEDKHMLGLEDVVSRMWDNLISRPSGPYGFRFLMQPAIGAIFAIRDGIKDARSGRSPYLATIVTERAKRGGRVREGFQATWKIIVIALAIDVVYQITELNTFHVGEATLVVVLIAILPYFLVRGPAMRVARWRLRRGGTSD
jgi:hypothetical protein